MALEVYVAASLRKYFPSYDAATGLQVSVEPGTSMKELAIQLGIPVEEVRLMMVNGRGAKLETLLQGDERVAFFPPVGGG